MDQSTYMDKDQIKRFNLALSLKLMDLDFSSDDPIMEGIGIEIAGSIYWVCLLGYFKIVDEKSIQLFKTLMLLIKK